MWDNFHQTRFKELINENYKGTQGMKHISLLLFVSSIIACTTSSEVNTAGGKAEHSIYCSGSEYSWEMCYQRASEICGAKEYDVIQKYKDEGAFAAYQSSQELPDRRLIIQCKE